MAGLLCSPREGQAAGGPQWSPTRSPVVQVQEGSALPVGLAATPVPRDSSTGMAGDAQSRLWDGCALSRVSRRLCPPDRAGSGLSACGAVCSVAAADGHRVCAREGQEGPLDLGCPCAWAVRGPGRAGGSSCQPAEADAFHLRVTGSCQGRAGNVRDCCRVTVQSGRWSMMDLSLQIQAVFKYSAESEVTAHGSRQNFCTSLQDLLAPWEGGHSRTNPSSSWWWLGTALGIVLGMARAPCAPCVWLVTQWRCREEAAAAAAAVLLLLQLLPVLPAAALLCQHQGTGESQERWGLPAAPHQSWHPPALR